MEERYDTALLGILQHEGKIERFLDVMFGFLFRRTDFYRILKSKEDKLGFPPGVALKMVASIHKKYETMASSIEKAKEKQKELMDRKKTEELAETSKTENEEKQPKAWETVDKTVEVETEKSNVEDIPLGKDNNTDSEKSGSVSDNSKTVEASQKAESDEGESITKVVKGDAENEVKTKGEKTEKTKTDKKDKKAIDPKTGEEDEDPELTRQQKVFQDDPESYNGARRENYRWAQSITDLDLRVNVASHVKKGRDCRVDTHGKHVKVEYKDTTGAWVLVVDGDLTWEVQKDETVWSLVPGDHIHINLEKKEERWWEGFFTDEPKISVRKIDASRPMSDLDQEAQAKIEEMMFNDRQKKLGLPQTHETKMHDMLRKAWDAEGSPFKGQPFDPSKFSVDPSGVMKMNQ